MKGRTHILAVPLLYLLTLAGCTAATPQMPSVTLNVATLCDSATDDDGKMSVHGTFDTIFATGFPAVHRRCSLAVRLTFAQEEFKKHAVQIRFLDSKGDRFLEDVETAMKVNPKDPGATITSENLIVNLTSLQVPREGTYFIQLWLDGRLLTTLHVYAKRPVKGKEA